MVGDERSCTKLIPGSPIASRMPLAALYYLRHMRSCAADAAGAKGTSLQYSATGVVSSSSMSEELASVLCVVVFVVLALVQLLTASVLRDSVACLGGSLSWTSAFALLSGDSTTVLACDALLRGNEAALFVLCMRMCNFHLRHRWSCSLFSCVLAVLFCPDLAVSVKAAYGFHALGRPAFPPKVLLVLIGPNLCSSSFYARDLGGSCNLGLPCF
jgi:hypothetical protein